MTVVPDTRGGSLKSLLRRADSLGSRLCLVLGDAELDRGVVAVKDLAEKAQSDVPRAELVKRLAYAESKAHEFPSRRNGVYPV